MERSVQLGHQLDSAAGFSVHPPGQVCVKFRWVGEGRDGCASASGSVRYGPVKCWPFMGTGELGREWVESTSGMPGAGVQPLSTWTSVWGWHERRDRSDSTGTHAVHP